MHPRRLSRILVFFLSALFLFSLRAESAEVYPSHPRLFFRVEKWGGNGLTLDELKDRTTRPGAEEMLSRLGGSLPNLALRSLLTGERAPAREALERLVQAIEFDGTTSDGIRVAFAAMAFDWLFNDPDFGEREKALAAGHIAEAAGRLMHSLERGSHIFHTRMYGWATGVALAGLALDGHHPDAARLAAYADRYYRERLFPARALQDGAVQNSFGYGRKYTMWLTGHFISCRLSATGENHWTDIRDNQGDWARREILFLIYGRYPNHSYLKFGDSYSLLSDNFTFRAVSERAQAYGDPLGKGFLKYLDRVNRGDLVESPTEYAYFLFYDPLWTGESFESLPARELFSRDGLGMTVWKTGWDADATTVFFKCGDYYDDHGHFDQGHLDIFRRAPLLVDSGAYLTFAGEFRSRYWHRSVAHNTILVMDPEIPGDIGDQRVFSSQGSSTMREYMADTRAETGDVLDYREEEWFSYVAGDITAAYTPDRAGRITRELAFVDGRRLVVLDRVSLAREGLEAGVLWHCSAVPDTLFDGKRFTVRRAGARLEVRCLLPSDAVLRWVEGFVSGGERIVPESDISGFGDIGAGRVEVIAPAGQAERLFLHLIDIGDVTDSPLDSLYAAEKAASRLPVSPVVTVGADAVTVNLPGGRSLRFRPDGPGLLP